MENLNAEQLVNLLEHCSKSKYCDGCTMRYNPRFLEARSFDPELVCGKVLIRWATELIKELTDENERLKEHNITLEQKFMLLGIDDVYVFKAKVKGE